MQNKNNIPTFNFEYYTKLKNLLLSEYKDNLSCSIIHGSSLFFDLKNREFSDIDVEVILKNVEKEDLQKIQKITNLLDIPTELQVRYVHEISDKESLLRKSEYKTFLFFPYSNGYALIGENIYQDLIEELSPAEVYRGILVAAQIEYKNIRKLYNKSKATSNLYLLNKTVNRFFTLYLINCKILDYKDLGKKSFYDLNGTGIVKLIKAEFADKFDKEDLLILDKYIKNYETNAFESSILVPLDKVYKNFLC